MSFDILVDRFCSLEVERPGVTWLLYIVGHFQKMMWEKTFWLCGIMLWVPAELTQPPHHPPHDPATVVRLVSPSSISPECSAGGPSQAFALDLPAQE